MAISARVNKASPCIWGIPGELHGCGQQPSGSNACASKSPGAAGPAGAATTFLTHMLSCESQTVKARFAK